MLWLPGFIPASLLQSIRASTPWGKPGFGKTVEGFAATEMATPACPALRTYLTGVFLAFSHRHSNDPWVRPHDGIPLRTFVDARRNARQLLLHDVRELLQLVLHLDHFLAHVEDDFDAREIHAHIASERKNHVQALQIAVRVKARVPLRARRFQQADAFIQAQRLRME